MFEKLNEKDKKTVTMGGFALIAILVLYVVYQGYSMRDESISQYKSIDTNLKTLNMSDSQYKNLLNSVPIFQMPQDEENQKIAFRDSLDQLFGDLRITTEPWVTVSSNNSRGTTTTRNYEKLLLKTSTSRECNFQTILNLLARLKYNPYYAGIEEFKITCNEDNPQMANFSIILSTFTNIKRGQR